MSLAIPGFRIDRLIAEGGMASVYLAVQESLGRTVALKVLKKFDSPTQSARFFAEGQVIASLNHRNVITIFDIGRVGDDHYLAMEYLNGGSLADRIRAGMTMPAILDILEDIGGCLDFVHARGVVHRDVKPDNILFHADGTPKLTDFGIAKQFDADQDLTMDGSAFGSPYYLSPEQACGRPLDGRTDIYALGVLFYEMLTGRKPYADESHVQTIVAHMNEPIPALPARFAAYQELLERMIAKAPEDRFSSAAELVGYVRGLRVAGTGKRPLAMALLGEPRRWSWSPRLPALGAVSTATIGIGAAMLVAAAGIAVWQPRPEQHPEVGLADSQGKIATPPAQLAEHSEPAVAEVDSDPAAAAEAGVSPETKTTLVAISEPAHASALPAAASVAAALPGEGSADAEPLVEAPPVASEVAGEVPADAERLVEVPVQEPEHEPTGVLGTAFVTEDKPPTRAKVNDPTPPSEEETLAQSIDEWMAAAARSLQAYRLTTPKQDSAYFYYRKVLAASPDHPEAQAGLATIADRYHAMARSHWQRHNARRARVYVHRGIGVQPNHPGLLALKAELERTPEPVAEHSMAEGDGANTGGRQDPQAEADKRQGGGFGRRFRRFWRSLID